jgi:two-component sensor histidine kinase
MRAASENRSKLHFQFGWPASLGAPGAGRRAVDVLPLGIDRERVDALRLLISEVVTNAVVHSGGNDRGRIDMMVEVTAGSVRVEIRDGGRGFVPHASRTTRSQGGLGTVVLDRLSSAWGTLSTPEFGVWFEFPGGYRTERRVKSERLVS